ncbi:unnamed protein product (macronuclear) [Paramecium tetraurelia]|uniref:Calponin-homology (CH) domain-containing protein n=1 Tax=Paramecium tetraurelia TaxID=5888 RepID=A0BP03_PARTE|nr:uncharacterized protein GSPATT00030909001 [Paramecium tetraurelia]CAK60270.1 unnamed protein product [Paramecium tetraurelia]|eukprot:XP_001427668.1 hypothetical protein (macronuclear) [Paramecium tetraurelia strain d4-2]
MDLPPLSELELQNIYSWLDKIPLSRPKKNIQRDFADGAMVAEVVYHYLPKLVEKHNYPQAHSIQQKQYNWSTLNLKVFKKLGFQLSKNDIDSVIACSPEAVERVLKLLQIKIEKYLEQQKELERRALEQQKQQQQQSQQKQQMQDDPLQNQDLRLILAEKNQAITELKETVEILQLKVKKLEQLLQIKDNKIQGLINQLQGKQ